MASTTRRRLPRCAPVESSLSSASRARFRGGLRVIVQCCNFLFPIVERAVEGFGGRFLPASASIEDKAGKGKKDGPRIGLLSFSSGGWDASLGAGVTSTDSVASDCISIRGASSGRDGGSGTSCCSTENGRSTVVSGVRTQLNDRQRQRLTF